MLLGYDAYGYNAGCAFSTTPVLDTFNKILLSNSVVDELYLDSDTTKSFNPNVESWGITTVLNALFQGNLSAGNINNGGVPITQIKLMRRLSDTLLWQDIALFNYDENIKIYNYTDNIITSGTDYEYALVPLTNSIIGNSIIESITSSFEGTFICDNTKSYKLFYNLNYSDIENVCPATEIQTFSQYPTILFSPLDYKKSSIKCQILTDSSLNGVIDVQAEKINRNNILKFFKSRKPFIFKNSAGDFMMVSLSNVKESRNNSFAQTIFEISFDWIECGDATDVTMLQQAGLSI